MTDQHADTVAVPKTPWGLLKWCLAQRRQTPIQRAIKQFDEDLAHVCPNCGEFPRTIVMPKVMLPEGYEPPSAAVLMPQPDSLITLPDGAYFFHEEGWTVQRDIKGRGWKVARIDGEEGRG